jgi:hypothetical protein
MFHSFRAVRTASGRFEISPSIHELAVGGAARAAVAVVSAGGRTDSKLAIPSRAATTGGYGPRLPSVG